MPSPREKRPVSSRGPSRPAAAVPRAASRDLLAVDVGNSETVVGLFRGAELASHWRLTSGRFTACLLYTSDAADD